MNKQPKAYWKGMCEHYKTLSDTGISELKYEKLNVKYLLSVLDELEVVGDELVGAIIDNAKNRHSLDKIIHAKLLFYPE